jgi:glucokinase
MGPAVDLGDSVRTMAEGTTADAARRRDVILAIDVGEGAFSAGLVTARGELIDRAVAEIEPDVGPQSHFAALASAVLAQRDQAAVHHDVRIRAIGVGCVGEIERNCVAVSPAHLSAWRAFPLAQHLHELTSLPIYGDLDAKALALAEGWLGAARGVRSFATMIVSASIGGGFVIDGELLEGRSGNAGHIGHLIVEPGGRRCRCGGRGCLEAEASGTAIETITGRRVDEPSYDIMRRTGRLVGRAGGMVCASLDLDLVVVSGTVAESFAATFYNAAQEEIDAVARVGQGAAARITASRLGDRGPLIGAGAVGWRGLRRAARGRHRMGNDTPTATEQPASDAR